LNKKFRKKIQNFGKDFNVKKREKTKFQKKTKNPIFFGKKNDFLLFFPIHFLFMENKQIRPKNDQKLQKDVFMSHL
jgi:hypothetical protein